MELTPMPWNHPSAQIDPGAKLGAGTKVWHNSHICGSNVHIGENCSFGQNSYVGNDVRIGRGCKVQNNVSIYDKVELGDFVFCGPSMVFTNVVNPRAHVPRKNEFKITKVGNGASLGANCTIVCGVELGRFSFVAAGAVVVKNVPAFGLVMGVPARHTNWICHCGVILDIKVGVSGSIQCKVCQSEYKVTGQSCDPTNLKECFEAK